jgi:hypothetical protein
MEKENLITRKMEPIEPDMITCNADCGGSKALQNSDNEYVCNLLGVDAKNGHTVGRGINADMCRPCIRLNKKS